MRTKLICLLVFCGFVGACAQEANENLSAYEVDPLRPSRAAFYSAVLPGLGQIYNKRYWKVPLVYGGLGASIYFYDFNQRNYKRYRNAYKRRLAGYSDDEFQELITDDDRLLDGQNFYKQNRDRSMLFIIGTYLLNILDANIDAHLKQYNVNDNLSLQPTFEHNTFTNEMQWGMALTLDF
ncbi:MAG: DUF5683 domain-containing protein [Flavobacteriaceae bacterium]